MHSIYPSFPAELYCSQGTHVVEIVRKDAKGTQMFGDVRASFRPKLARHQRHKGRNSTTVPRYTQKFRAYELNRVEPNTAVCQVSVPQRLYQITDKSLGTSFQSKQALDYITTQLTQTQKYS